MPITPTFDNTVVHINNSPIGAANVNATIAIWNAAGYWFTDLKFINASNAVALFVKMDAIYGYTQPQKVNEVDYDQAALDADKAAEILNGYWPTGIFIRPIGDEIDIIVLVHYQLLDQAPT